MRPSWLRSFAVGVGWRYGVRDQDSNVGVLLLRDPDQSLAFRGTRHERVHDEKGRAFHDLLDARTTAEVGHGDSSIRESAQLPHEILRCGERAGQEHDSIHGFCAAHSKAPLDPAVVSMFFKTLESPQDTKRLPLGSVASKL